MLLLIVTLNVLNHTPGRQELLRDTPAVDNQLLKSLSDLRQDALESGAQSVLVEDLDFKMSNEGTWSRAFLKREGYHIGQKAWKSVIKRTKQNQKKTWQEKRASRRGGRPSKMTEDVLRVSRKLLEKHSKPGSKVARVHRNMDGSFGPHHARGDQSQEAAVPSHSLLTTPARLYKEEPEIRKHLSRKSFYVLLKRHFADFRSGQRRTDVCSHCQCYWQEIVPRFHRDLRKIQTDLKAVYPLYFQHFVEQEHSDVGEEAQCVLTYIRRHARNFADERRLSGCDQLQLYSFTEAPAEVLLKGHLSLLKSYLWHMLSARRQQNVLQALMADLPEKTTLLVYDWKEKIRLPLGPNETSDMWHAQQKYAISCFGCSSFHWQTVSGRSQVQRLGKDFILHVLWFVQF